MLEGSGETRASCIPHPWGLRGVSHTETLVCSAQGQAKALLSGTHCKQISKAVLIGTPIQEKPPILSSQHKVWQKKGREPLTSAGSPRT